MIRHGQASFGAANYDRLSPLGQRQCRLAGEHLQTLGLKFDAVYRGRLARQESSLDALSAGYGSLPPAQVDSAFDEYDADSLFKAYLPAILQKDKALASRITDIRTDRRLFQDVFSRVMEAWLQGTTHAREGLETWPQFLHRVEQGLARIVAEQPRTANVAVVTSGGPIAATLRSTLALADSQAIRINYGIYNASISRFRMGRSRRRLVGFNDIAHLELARDPQLISFR